jgi:hypothetical protein
VPCGCALIAYLGLSVLDGSARTIQFEIDQWSNNNWGFHALSRSHARCEIAISGAGDRRNRCETQSFRSYFSPERTVVLETLYQREAHSGYSLSVEERTAQGGPCACTWTAMRPPAADAGCSQTAQMLRPGAVRAGAGTIAGVSIVRYRRRDAGETTWLSLSPELGCEVMEEITDRSWILGIPNSRWRFRVTSYKSGEPDRAVFELPAGYRIRPRPM